MLNCAPSMCKQLNCLRSNVRYIFALWHHYRACAKAHLVIATCLNSRREKITTAKQVKKHASHALKTGRAGKVKTVRKRQSTASFRSPPIERQHRFLYEQFADRCDRVQSMSGEGALLRLSLAVAWEWKRVRALNTKGGEGMPFALPASTHCASVGPVTPRSVFSRNVNHFCWFVWVTFAWSIVTHAWSIVCCKRGTTEHHAGFVLTPGIHPSNITSSFRTRFSEYDLLHNLSLPYRCTTLSRECIRNSTQQLIVSFRSTA